MNKLKSRLSSLPVYPYLLPLFFVFHGFNEFFYLVPLTVAVKLVLAYIGIAVGLSLLFWLLYRSFRKASLMSFFLLAIVLFYGSIHDFFKQQAPASFLVRYSFILPFLLLSIVSAIIFLKKTRRQLIRATQYLNIVFLILFLMELGVLLSKLPHQQLPLTDTIQGNKALSVIRSKPDIYLIVADEYAGKQELNDLFQFDNSRFEDSLKQRGFHIINNTISNYNWTVYSIASMLNMDYLKNLRQDSLNNFDMLLCSEAIEHNNVIRFLQEHGYELHNNSLFDIKDHPKHVRPAFFSERAELITASTLPDRMQKDIGFNFVSEKALLEAKKKSLRNNEKIERLTKESIRKRTSAPRFVYTHLVMPHYYYFFDSSGKETSLRYLETESASDKNAYIQYLVYTNKKLLELTDSILTSSQTPPVIILMSDHGYRHLKRNVDRKYHFMTINTVFIPNKDYSGFYEGMSNVNQFRVLFNNLFGQNFPMLKDSTIFIKGY